MPALARIVHDNPQLPLYVHPEQLPDLVVEWASFSCDWSVSKAGSEWEVRAAYGLVECSPDVLETRSWVDRARDLIRDGWAKVRGLFRQEKPPEPEPVADNPVTDDDGVDWATWAEETKAREEESEDEMQRFLGQGKLAIDFRPPPKPILKDETNEPPSPTNRRTI